MYKSRIYETNIIVSNDSEDDNLYIERSNRESSVKTLLELSVVTPNEPKENRATFKRSVSYEAGILPPLKIEILEDKEI